LKNDPFSWPKSDSEKYAPFFDNLDFHPVSGQFPFEKSGVDSP